MIFKEIRPSGELQELVRYYLLVNLSFDVSPFPVKPYPARIEQALVFFGRGHIECIDPGNQTRKRITRNAIFGQQVSRLNFQPVGSPDFLMLMVIFQPGAMHRILRVPSYELSQLYCDAESVMNSALQDVNDAIANSPTYPQMIQHVENFLIRKKSSLDIDRHPIDRIGNLLLHNPTLFSLDYISRQANLSPRQLERKFHERIGVRPKLYSRISRFFKAFEYKELNPHTDWLTIALQFGYADYYHLSKDFKQFATVTPNIMIEEWYERPEAKAERQKHIPPITLIRDY